MLRISCLLGHSSLITIHLRPKAASRVSTRLSVSLGAKIFDELSQLNAKLFHADAYCTALARSQASELHSIDMTRYAEYDHTWGKLPVVGIGGDELQLPPVPMESGLFAPLEGTSAEHKTGVKILNTFSHVYRLTTAMRFKDPVLVAILRKMRTSGGSALTPSEWEALQATEISGPDCSRLTGTELWYESAYEWSVVTMAQVSRSQKSAQMHGSILFVIQAEDEYMSALDPRQHHVDFDDGRLRSEINEKVLRHANMNETGRMPGFAMLHVGMKIRLTQTPEPGFIVTDATGVVVGIEFDPRESEVALVASRAAEIPVLVLQYLPVAVYVQLDVPDGVAPLDVPFIDSRPCPLHAGQGTQASCPDCTDYTNVVAITPYTNVTPW